MLYQHGRTATNEMRSLVGYTDDQCDAPKTSVGRNFESFFFGGDIVIAAVRLTREVDIVRWLPSSNAQIAVKRCLHSTCRGGGDTCSSWFQSC